MTISSIDVSAGPYTGNGIADTFGYDFKIFDKTQLRVVQTDTEGVETVLVVDSDYSITGVGMDAGGDVVTTVPLATGYTLYFRADIEATQETNFASQGRFYPEVHEDAFDKLTLLIQQLNSVAQRAVRLSDDVELGGLLTFSESVADRAGKTLRFDVNGDLELVEMGNVEGINIETVSVTAGTTVVNVPFPYIPNTGTLWLVVNGAFVPGSAFTQDAGIVTFTNPLPAGEVTFFGLNAAPIGVADSSNISYYDETVRDALDARLVTVATLGELLAGNPTLGSNYKTLGYNSAGDGGGNDYTIVAGGTGVADGGSYVDADNGLQLKASFDNGVVSAKQFGAVYGDAADNLAQLNNARDFCKNTSYELSLGYGAYGISAPWVHTSQIKITGNYSKGETVVSTSIKKLAGFSGSAAIDVGDGVNGVQGFVLQGVYINGNGQVGDGLKTVKTANVTLRDVQSEYNTGIGLNIDGQWLSNWYNLGARYNTSGGLLLTGTNREVSDLRVYGFAANNNGGYQMRWAGIYRVKSTSIFGLILELPAADSILFECLASERCRIFGGELAQKINLNGPCVKIGDATNAVSDLQFFGTYFQHNPANTALHAINTDNASDVSFIEPFNTGSGRFLSCPSGATALSDIRVIGGNYTKSEITDTANVVSYVSLDNLKLGDINSDGIVHLRNESWGKRLDLDIRNAVGAVLTYQFGAGSSNNTADFVNNMLRLRHQSTAPAGAQTGCVAISDGTGGGFDGASGAGIYRYTGAAWVFVG